MIRYALACRRSVRTALRPEIQEALAWLSLVITLIGWPLTTLPFSPFHRDEPAFILSLSWWAVLETALGRISASQANVQVSKDA